MFLVYESTTFQLLNGICPVATPLLASILLNASACLFSTDIYQQARILHCLNKDLDVQGLACSMH